MRFDALIFDCDGTLVDTMPTHYRAWTATLDRYGMTFTEDRFYSLGGVPARNIIAMLADEQGIEVDAATVAEEKEQGFHDLAHTVEAIEPVVAIARKHRGKLPMGVATGSPSWSANLLLGHAGILDWFDTLVGADHVDNPKPDPEVYLKAAQQVGADPKRCCAYEDTDLGLSAARAAGMEAVDIRHLL